VRTFKLPVAPGKTTTLWRYRIKVSSLAFHSRDEGALPSTATISAMQMNTARFQMGRLLITPGARDELSPIDVMKGLQAHLTGHWGDLDEYDKKVNEEALKMDGRLFSAYHSAKGTKFWVITEADRSATTILLPEEY
jgi:hypothetical protein